MSSLSKKTTIFVRKWLFFIDFHPYHFFINISFLYYKCILKDGVYEKRDLPNAQRY